MIGINSVPGGDSVGNGWNRPIGMDSGMDYFVGAWVNSGNGGEVRAWDGSGWQLQSATWGANPDSIGTTKNNTSLTVSFNFAGLGLSVGDTFLFDIYTSGGGGGDTAVDALGNPSTTVVNWGDYYNSGQNVLSYTLVPEPAAGGLLCIGTVLLLSRRFSFKR